MTQRTSAGLYVVDWFSDFTLWLQWRAWRRLALGFKSCSQKLTVSFEAPPELAATVSLVLQHETQIREDIGKEKGWMSRSFKALSSDAPPWTPWAKEGCSALLNAEYQRREIQGTNFSHAPIYPLDPRQCLAFIRAQCIPAVPRKEAAGYMSEAAE